MSLSSRRGKPATSSAPCLNKKKKKKGNLLYLPCIPLQTIYHRKAIRHKMINTPMSSVDVDLLSSTIKTSNFLSKQADGSAQRFCLIRCQCAHSATHPSLSVTGNTNPHTSLRGCR